MKKFIISEEEKSRILGMHVNSGYKTEINEQSEPQQGTSVSRVVELNNKFVEQDPKGKILGQNPKFVQLANNNNINLRALTILANKSQVEWTGPDNKYYSFNFLQYDGEDYTGAKEKYNKARNTVFAYWQEVKANPKIKQCVNPKMAKLSDVAKTDSVCVANKVSDKFNKIVNDTKYRLYKYLSSISDFVEKGPRLKTKTV